MNRIFSGTPAPRSCGRAREGCVYAATAELYRSPARRGAAKASASPQYRRACSGRSCPIRESPWRRCLRSRHAAPVPNRANFSADSHSCRTVLLSGTLATAGARVSSMRRYGVPVPIPGTTRQVRQGYKRFAMADRSGGTRRAMCGWKTPDRVPLPWPWAPMQARISRVN